MKKAVIFNLGCKVNQYECDVLAAELKARGYGVSDELGYADLYIVNTCAVTGEAERKSRQIISRCLKHNILYRFGGCIRFRSRGQESYSR